MTITLTREEAQQVLDALNEYVGVVVSVNDPYNWTPKVADGGEPAREAIELLRARLAQPEPGASVEPVAWLFQHEETGLTDCIDTQQVEWGFEKNNPRWQKIAPLYTAPPQRECKCKHCGGINVC
jgi:hypothetical protein